MNFTSQQKQVIAARGNVLVIAGAGTGKTRTLVERCLNILLEEKPSVSLEEILMVTFTEAAAAEMRQRIRARLEEELAKTPNAPRWQEQLALFDAAHIGTLHSFCLQLVRQHFYELELDPQLAVLPEEEARLLADETLNTILQSHYAGDSALDEALQGLIQTQGRGWDKPIRALVLKLHNYTQTLPDPDGWFREQLKIFESPEPVKWRQWLDEALVDWAKDSQPFLRSLASQNELAAKAATLLRGDEDVAAVLESIVKIPEQCPSGKKGKLLAPLKDFFDDACFLHSLVHESDGKDPLVEDWTWARANMLALLRLARDFSLKFAEAKRELGGLDFHDLEQHALRLLWDRVTKLPTAIAREWQRRLRFIFVDEYQDINAAQDKIIEALSSEGARANRFLVGDVKQSIYRFRLANPRIFQNYAETWRGETGRAIPLTDNFRSREGLLTFVNSLFELMMRRELGGLSYDEQARLRFGAPEERRSLTSATDPSPRVELHVRLTDGEENEPGDENDALSNVAELEDANKEARLVALRLRELKEQRHQIWDEVAKSFRAVEWSDMAVLLRSPSGKAEAYAKEFSQLGVPLVVARRGFFGSLEISDLLNLLRLLDNPLQDLPALAVLHSPLVGLTADELATIRLAATKVPFWTALVRNQESEVKSQKVETFLARFARWRKLVRQASLSRCLEAVLAETHYAEGLLTQPRGEQRRANVQRLLHLAQQFDQFQRQGLFRFLRFVEAQQEAEMEPEVAAATEENAVRLMSIHQSKGLEFPVVAVANLAKAFNFSDLSADIILDEKFGLCPQIKPPQTGRRYPSLPHWLARRRQKAEMLGEELRLFYVATTRARDTLILTASISEKKFESRWNDPGGATTASLLSARSYADWLGIWFAKNCAATGNLQDSGQTSMLRWTIGDDTKLVLPDSGIAGVALDESEFTADVEVWNELERRVAWQYPFKAATEKTAKVSVSTLRREATETADEDAEDWAKAKFQIQNSKFRTGGNKKSAADIGTAHHKFLQFVSLEQLGGVGELKTQAERLERGKVLSSEEIALLDFNAIAEFWQSELGQNIRKHLSCVRRELAFTARFSAKELAEVTGRPLEPGLGDEFVIVQGVADLALILAKEIWLVDFKTDVVGRGELADKVRVYEPQLKLYAMALSRIYQKPVTTSWLYFLSEREAVRVRQT